jgi:pentalenolactone synthase
MRALLQPQFSPKRMRELTGRVESLTTELLDDFATWPQPADLHAGLALPLPIFVICELLGVPYGDRDQFRTWSEAVGDVVDRGRSERGLRDLFEYGVQLVQRKRREPGDDVITRFCATDGLGDNEIAMLSMSLLFAGHETTVRQIGLGALLLLTNPDQRDKLRQQPALLPSAIDEILRAPGRGGGGIPRYARVDFDLAGVTIKAGDLVMLDNTAANHDAGVFPEPDTFDITRSAAASHLSFGHGARYCIGAPLARIELRAAFDQLITRFPAMRLAVPLTELKVSDDLVGDLVDLPVTW